VLVLACEHGAAAGRIGDTVVLPCVAMAPPSLIDFILSRDLADGVVVAGCAESACYNRLGIQWTEQRFAAERDPYLRARVPRDRIATVWASALAVATAEAAISDFVARVAPMAPKRLRSPLPVSSPTRLPQAVEREGGLT
jgi:coenzyme F420-reducing hydrogenase delta subunit